MRPPRSSSSPSSSSSSYSLAATSLKSRLLTIFKKAQELTTLCDIEACVIHYGPDGELKTWPENRDKVRDLALRYIQLDQAKRRKKSLNLYEFLSNNKDKKKMTNSFKKKAKRNLEEEVKYPISDHYSLDPINELIHSLELSYSTLQERRRFLAAKKQNESLNPSQITPLPQESGLENQELFVYDQNNNNNSFQHLCVSEVQESRLHYQLMPYGVYYDQNMCTGDNVQDPCVSSNTHDYSVFPLELQESVSNYGLNQLMQHELLYGFDQNMCMSDITNSFNVEDPYLSNMLPDGLCFDFQDPCCGNMIGNPSFSQDFPDMSSSYVYENRLLQESTLPSL